MVLHKYKINLKIPRYILQTHYHGSILCPYSTPN